MNRNLIVLAFSLMAACATAPRIITTADDTIATIDMVADDIVRADVVVLGEMHGVAAVHSMHLRLIQELHRLRPNMVIAMEMFERDVQGRLLQYLTGQVTEDLFLAESRPWKGYGTDYRPVIEFARRQGVVVLAANAPRELAREVSVDGIESVLGNPYVARETTAPEDSYWDAFVDSMKGHDSLDGVDALQRYYAAQCLKDDTMAESIVDHLKAFSEPKPLVVLIVGRMHSDYGRGTVARIRSRMPALDVRVLSAEEVGDIGSGEYSSRRNVADYVIVVPDPEWVEPLPNAAVVAAAAAEAEAKAKAMAEADAAAEPEAGAEPEAEAAPEERAALGLMPDYAGADEGVLINLLRPGGSAELAGLQVGDLIIALAGSTVVDVQDYVQVLGGLRVGQKVKVKVRRGDKEHEFEVTLTARTR